MINQVSVDQGNNHWEELEKASLNCKKKKKQINRVYYEHNAKNKSVVSKVGPQGLQCWMF